MGRKPNALILEYFERGQKLEDASNRYQHTCKACGEKFPKGRIDSLVNHLVKKCPAISLRDRQKVLLQLNNLPDLADDSRARNGDAPVNGPTVELPVVNRNWTALETLAEVSRQINRNETEVDRTVHNNSAGARSRASEPPRPDRLELQEQYTLDNPPVSYEQRVQREKRILSQKTAPRRDSDAALPSANFNQLPNSRSASPNLSMTTTSMAAAAVAAAGRSFVPNMVDPQLLAEDMNLPLHIGDMSEAKAMAQLSHANAAMSDHFFNTGSDQSGWSMLDGSGANLYPDPDNVNVNVNMNIEQSAKAASPSIADSYPRLSMNQGNVNQSMNQVNMGPNTNQNPLNPNNVNQGVMNQGMTTEFRTEWDDGQKSNRPKVRGKFTTARRKQVQEVRKLGACIRCRMLKKPCSQETPCGTCRNVESARVWKQPCVRTRLADEVDMYSAGLHAVLAYHEVNSAKRGVKFIASPYQIDASHYPETTVYATFKALEYQDVAASGNIDPNLGLGNNFHNSDFRILDNDNDDLPLKLEAYMKRMSSIFFEREPSHFMNVTLNTALELSVQKEDDLLKRALDLWSIVHILIDHELRWTTTQRGNIDDAAGNGRPIEQREGDRTYPVICLQLNAAAEKKAAQVCNGVFRNLEGRLLKSSNNCTFELFLVSIIALNCLEKSTWLFKSWEQENFTSRWPLDKGPSWYASQGDRIIDLLQMLLRIKSVPPKTYTREDGILATDADQTAREYYEKIQLSYLEVLDKQNNHIFDPANSRCYELRFCSRLILPIN
ncbi:hypothetical protein PVAG01_01900 [Phlyctema vagabunda]|uniref:Zn 2cys6 transcription factor protein n=1 Tax=Phlyctema vagabunda TaxID=108571 RepID=A0ABR4PZE9_9HELO